MWVIEIPFSSIDASMQVNFRACLTKYHRNPRIFLEKTATFGWGYKYLVIVIRNNISHLNCCILRGLLLVYRSMALPVAAPCLSPVLWIESTYIGEHLECLPVLSHTKLETVVNPLMLAMAKRSLTMLVKSLFGKIFEEELFARTFLTILLQIFCKIIINT